MENKKPANPRIYIIGAGLVCVICGSILIVTGHTEGNGIAVAGIGLIFLCVLS